MELNAVFLISLHAFKNLVQNFFFHETFIFDIYVESILHILNFFAPRRLKSVQRLYKCFMENVYLIIKLSAQFKHNY